MAHLPVNRINIGSAVHILFLTTEQIIISAEIILVNVFQNVLMQNVTGKRCILDRRERTEKGKLSTKLTGFTLTVSFLHMNDRTDIIGV